MTITTTSNVMAFDVSLYTSLNAIVLKYFREDPQLNWLPQATVSPMDCPEYKKPIFGESIGTRGTTNLGLPDLRMQTPKNHKVYQLNYVESDIFYDVNDMMLEGPYLAQRKAQELAVWENQVKQAVFKGVRMGGYTAAGVGTGPVLNYGIIEGCSIVIDFSSSADALLDAAGDVYRALTAMVEAIPFRYRDGRVVQLGCTSGFVTKGRRALFRGATNQISELDLFLQEFSGPNAPTGFKVAPTIIASDALFLNGVAGTTFTEVDTLGTHDRLFACIPDPNLIEQVYSRVGMVGEETHPSIQSVTQKWAARLAGCVHDSNTAKFSERITWA